MDILAQDSEALYSPYISIPEIWIKKDPLKVEIGEIKEIPSSIMFTFVYANHLAT